MRYTSRIVFVLCFAVSFASAQTQPTAVAVPPSTVASGSVNVQELVEKQFGPEFQVVGPARLDVDMNGDDVPDAVIAARSKDPLLGEGEYHYKVIDPYGDFFGYGNPKVTLQFAMKADPAQDNMVLLIIHGVGAEGPQALVPKAKFVLVNVPYQKLGFKHATLKKKVVTTIMAEDVDEVEAAVYWDGKKYKWEPLGSSH